MHERYRQTDNRRTGDSTNVNAPVCEPSGWIKCLTWCSRTRYMYMTQSALVTQRITPITPHRKIIHD